MFPQATCLTALFLQNKLRMFVELGQSISSSEPLDLTGSSYNSHQSSLGPKLGKLKKYRYCCLEIK